VRWQSVLIWTAPQSVHTSNRAMADELTKIDHFFTFHTHPGSASRR
jgi:hypothetical protein